MRAFQSLRRYATASNKTPLHELKRRGMLAQLTSQRLDALLSQRKLVLYGGVDPSAPSLHVGNLAMLMTLLHFHLQGHRVIPLVGGATGRVGDPGGRTSERDLLAQATVDNNASGITRQLERFFERASQYAARRGSPADLGSPRILNNLQWQSSLSMLDFLRFPGKLLRVNALLTRESVKARLGSSQGISYAEFSYQLLQAYDFYYLHKEHGVELQIGGSDQWGNIVSGIELIRKASRDGASEPEEEIDPVFGLTIPLLTTSTGEKFGKSAGNAIWLDESMTSAFDFYQFFMRVSDTEVLPYLKCLTLAPVEEIDSLYLEHMQNPEGRLAQHRLASEVTELIHGVDALKGAQAATSALFGSSGSSKGSPSTLQPDATSFLNAIGDHPRLRKVRREEVQGQTITKVAAGYGLVASHGKAKSLLAAGGLYLNNARVTSLEQKMRLDDFFDGRVAVLKAGKGELLILELL